MSNLNKSRFFLSVLLLSSITAIVFNNLEASSQFFSSTQAIIFIYIQEPMRDTPDLEISAPTDFKAIIDGGGQESSTAMAIYNDSGHSDETLSFQPMLVLTTPSANNNRAGRAFINDATNGFLALDAEL